MIEEPPEGPVPLEPPPPEPERVPFWGYPDLLLFAGLTIPSMLAGFALGMGIVAVLHLKQLAPAAPILIEQFTGYAILFTALKVMFRAQYDRPFWRSLGWIPSGRPLPQFIVAGFAVALAVSVIGVAIKTPSAPNPMTELLKDRASILLVGIFAVTAGPVCEELAFRGFLQPLLVRSLGVVPGILAAAVPFGLLHLPEYGYSWRHGVLVTLAGAAFGWVRHSTGSLKAAVVMHASYNGFFFVALLAANRAAGMGGH